MIEAELKARLTEPEQVRAALAELAPAEAATYDDTYYDTPAGDLDRGGREIRIRTVETADTVRQLLTFKEPAVDEESGSKPEHETIVANPAAVAHMLTALGYGPYVSLTKDCENHRFTADGREFLATVVRVPKIGGTFLEVETMAEDDDVDAALSAVRSVMADLGVDASQLTNERYTDAVREARRS